MGKSDIENPILEENTSKDISFIEWFNKFLGIPSIISGYSFIYPEDQLTIKLIDKLLLLNFIGYKGIMIAMIILWGMVLMSFYNAYVYFDPTLDGDFGTYPIFIVYKLLVYGMGMSVLNSKRHLDQTFFLISLFLAIFMDVGLLIYDATLVDFTPFFEYIVLGLDGFLFYSGIAFKKLIQIRGKMILAAPKAATKNVVRKLVKKSSKPKKIITKKDVMVNFQGYGATLVAVSIAWIFFNFMGMALSSISQFVTSQSLFLLLSFIRLIIFAIGIFSYVRRDLKTSKWFSTAIIFIVCVDVIYAWKEILSAYSNKFLPFNYLIMSILDIFLLVKSIRFCNILIELDKINAVNNAVLSKKFTQVTL